ncbi:MAG: DUF438 domain-containing protein [Firmicutes bacterium]|nr:DUF438 domain-containing protein [Bacillota bacterium]
MSDNNFDQQKKVIKEIITGLHEGLSLEEAKQRMEDEVGIISSLEIAEVEQSLINEGMSTDEIKKFCNVHALLFETTLQEDLAKEESPGHPVNLFKAENREIEKITEALKALIAKSPQINAAAFRTELEGLLKNLKDLELHYVRKEQLLFPYLERYGFMGPSKVMWGKHNEVRDLYKQAIAAAESITEPGDPEKYIGEHLNLLIEEVDGMIFKEENILFPTSLEKLQTEDWIDILKESDQVGYAYIEQPAETSHMIDALKKAAADKPAIKDNKIKLPSGFISPEQLMHMLNALPVDVTFVDHEDTVRYFSENKARIFVRTRAIVGRNVQNCHPPQSVDQVEKILNSFKEGTRDSAEFWLTLQGKMIYIVFYAVRDHNGKYLGTLEVAQDITALRKLEGERRLLDEGN